MFRSWVNGKLADALAIDERSINFADGIFETIRLQNGQAPLLALHLARMQRGAATLNIPFEAQQIERDLALAVAYSQQHPAQCLRLKYILSRGVSNTGYRAANLMPTRIMRVQAFERDVRALQMGVKAQFCQWPLSSQAQLAGIKHLNRLDQVMASQELAADVFEGITRDQQGIIVEGTMTNLFMRTEQGTWQTPSLATAGVAGVMRQCLLEQVFPDFGEAVTSVQCTDFQGIAELFVCNALIGIVPVVELDGQCFTISEQTQRLQSTINKIIQL